MQMSNEFDLIFQDVKKNIGVVDSLKILYKGINSSIYLLEIKSSKLILKIFNRNNKNILDRFDREIRAYKLFKDNNFKFTPKILYFNKDMRYIILSYIEGEKIYKFEIDFIKDIYNFNYFFRRGNTLFSENIKNASESALDLLDFYNNIDLKISSIREKLLKVDDHDNYKFISKLKDEFEKIKIDYIYNLPKLRREDHVFSQSDVGIHNCLLIGKKILFLDFEHSGWDDPSKQLCDWVLRPDCGLNENDCINLLNTFINKWDDNDLRERLIFMLPLINIKWILIRLRIGLKNNNALLDMNLNENIYSNGIQRINRINESFSI